MNPQLWAPALAQLGEIVSLTKLRERNTRDGLRACYLCNGTGIDKIDTIAKRGCYPCNGTGRISVPMKGAA